MDYRREIDGLRALAVMPVILFHAGFEFFGGGFVGVDVFFVISGYLITTIILSELERGKFSLVDFYERRARRILPALFFVMLFSIPFAWFLLSPAELVSFSKSLVAVPLFLSNFFFWRDGGYFETAAELKPLLHTWSLAVEEQYYVLFPLFLMVLWKFGKSWILISLATAFVVSLAYAQWAVYRQPTAAFFLLPARGWELAIGAFTAFYLSQTNRKEFGKLAGEVGGWLGVVLILFAVFAFSEATPFPGVYALVPTIGTVLIIVFAKSGTSVASFVGNRLFVGVGLVSYSAYLWHQPILAYARYWDPEIEQPFIAFLVATVFFVSFLSWKYIETPFRSRRGFGREFVFGISFLFGGLFVSFGLLSSRVDFNQEEIMASELSRSEAIFSSNMNERIFIRSRIQHEKSKPEAIVLGSSRIMQVGSKLANMNVLNLSVSGASIEDIVAIWEMASNRFDPSYVFIGADPWIFNLNSSQERWSALSEEYKTALRNLGFNKAITIPEQKRPPFLNEVFVGIYRFINQSTIKALDDSPSIVDKIRSDGSRVYNISYAEKSVMEVERSAPGFISYAMSNYRFSSEVKNILEGFVGGFISSHRKIVFVLSPYHPTLYDLMRSDDKKFLEIENIFRDIAKVSGFQIIGSYDPAKVGCSGEEFFDGMHPKDSCMEKVLAELRK